MTEKFKNLSYITQHITGYFSSFMVLIYLVLGLTFIFSTRIFPEINQTVKLVFGCILVIYAIFRAYRAIKNLKHDNPV